MEEREQKGKTPLIGPDGGRIKTFGKKMMRLEFSGNKIYEQEFMIAKIEIQILAVDFSFDFNFSINLKKNESSSKIVRGRKPKEWRAQKCK